MKYMLSFLLVFLVFEGELTAQDEKRSTSEFSYILTDLSYISDAVFMGRRDSVRAPYVLPSIGYYDKKGFFADASLSYLVGPEENRVDLILLSLGYIFRKNKLHAGVSGTKYFFNEESYNVQAETEGSITAMINYDFSVAEVTLSGASYFNSGNSTDFVTTLMLDRVFFGINQKLLVNPSVTVGAGSQYFYEQYYRGNRMGNRQSGSPGSPGSGRHIPVESTTVDFKEASEFNILYFEIGMSLHYFHKSFIFSFAPAWSLPQSSVTILTENGEFEEDLQDTFYWSVGISYWFGPAKKKR